MKEHRDKYTSNHDLMQWYEQCREDEAAIRRELEPDDFDDDYDPFSWDVDPSDGEYWDGGDDGWDDYYDFRLGPQHDYDWLDDGMDEIWYARSGLPPSLFETMETHYQRLWRECGY